MPSLISETRTYLQSHYGLSLRDVDALMSLDTGSDVAFDGETLDESAVNYFETVADGRDPKVVVNW
jgi:aspartyl-tRNA(Asn)/glutamyl-tRNA(Gln) amidotransferase subunit B